ncbi:hypothetical protein PQX77_014164 [Marasmius sp. AFHP31]|nr:hypothetical protein PQX77_014164 [Marasmius sp. AFHP31]
MHFTKFFALSAMTTLAVATAIVRRNDGDGSGGEEPGSCTSGLQCCESTSTASDPAVTKILDGLGITLSDLNVLVGLTCSPITVVGSSSSCGGSTTVYCDDTTHGTLISIGCVPVTV